MLQYCLYDLVTAATRKEPAEKQTSQTTNLYLWLKQGIGWQRDWVDTTITRIMVYNGHREISLVVAGR